PRHSKQTDTADADRGHGLRTGCEASGSFPKDAVQFVHHDPHSRASPNVGMDDEPDVEPLGFLDWEGAFQVWSGIAQKAGQIASTPPRAYRLEHGSDAVGPQRDAAAVDAILDVPQR